MTDLIRRSAANLLAISVALAAEEGDAPEDIAASTDKPPTPAGPSFLPHETEAEVTRARIATFSC